MDGRDFMKLFGIISAFFILGYLSRITLGTEYFSPAQLFVTYSQIIYSIGVEVYDLSVPRRPK